MSLSSFDNSETEHLDKLKGTTLKVYMLLVRNKDNELGVREVYRELELSNVSLASYHLNRLVEYDLVTKTDDNRYKLKKYVSLGELENYYRLKGRLIPNEFFFLSFYLFSLIWAVVGLLFNILPIFIISSLGIGIVTIARSTHSIWKSWIDKDNQES
ncbi:MAG: hypothetical protein ACW981_17100 [Candidatus Hodarchaeales archaeon]|jgi:hypothetical protein